MNKLILAGGLALVLSGSALADELVVFPAKDQTKEQQAEDKAACYVWAVEETGFDPASAVVHVDAPEQKRGGAVRGAVLGNLIGEDTEATATGAAIGAARQGRKNRQAVEAAEEERKRQEAEVAAKTEHFNKARAVCLEAKGYTVK